MKISWQHEWQQWTEMRTDRGQKKRIEPSFSSLLFLHLDKKKQRWSTVLLAGILIKKKKQRWCHIRTLSVVIGTIVDSGEPQVVLTWTWALSVFQDWTYFGEGWWGEGGGRTRLLKGTHLFLPDSTEHVRSCTSCFWSVSFLE